MELQISPHFFYYSFNPETPIGRELLDNRRIGWMDKTEMPERNSVTESIFYIIIYLRVEGVYHCNSGKNLLKQVRNALKVIGFTNTSEAPAAIAFSRSAVKA